MTAIKPERLGDVDQAAAVAEFEGEIREFVRRDVSFWRRNRQEPATDAVAENVNSVIQRMAGASIEEVERVIAELQTVRDLLRAEGERVQREIAGYATLGQAAMSSMKIISESLARWRPADPQSRQEPRQEPRQEAARIEPPPQEDLRSEAG
jgi:hypothetical protein